MKFLYDAIYLMLLLIGLPWLFWRIVVQRKNRSGWKQKLFGLSPIRKTNGPCIWIHAVSVGEVNLLPKFVAGLKQRFPELSFAISSTTDSGLQLAKDRFPDEIVFFCPSDFSWAVNQSLRRIRPDMLILTELELWPNLIGQTANRHIPVVLINGRISSGSFSGYRRLWPMFDSVLKRISLACVQTQDYQDRMIELGMPGARIKRTGNIKFDNAFETTSVKENPVSRIANYQPDNFVFVAGSTMEIEDLMILELYDDLRLKFPQLRLVLVPRHPERVTRIKSRIRNTGIRYVLRSQLDNADCRGSHCEILIVDVVGELAWWWQLADAGFVGGSMGRRGGQNMIEPAASGVPVSFGPDTENFKDVANILLENQGARRVQTKDDLRQFIEWSIVNNEAAQAMGQRGHDIVRSQQGALQQTISMVSEILIQQLAVTSTTRTAA